MCKSMYINNLKVKEMKKSTYTITKRNEQFRLQLYTADALLILESKPFDTFRACQKFLDTLRVHLCFQTNFSRAKNRAGQYGFDIRTCWDDLIASSSWFARRKEREEIMQSTFDANKNAVFVHTSFSLKRESTVLQEVA